MVVLIVAVSMSCTGVASYFYIHYLINMFLFSFPAPLPWIFFTLLRMTQLVPFFGFLYRILVKSAIKRAPSCKRNVWLKLSDNFVTKMEIKNSPWTVPSLIFFNTHDKSTVIYSHDPDIQVHVCKSEKYIVNKCQVLVSRISFSSHCMLSPSFLWI